MDENQRHRAMAWLLASLGAAAIIAVMMYDAKAHQSPSGWRYPTICCSDRDCKPSADVQEVRGGYLLTTTGEIVPYGDRRVKNAPDGEFHVCQQGGNFDTGRILCLFVPPHSF